MTIPFVTQFVKDGVFVAGDNHDKAAALMLDELLRWTTALQTLRN